MPKTSKPRAAKAAKKPARKRAPVTPAGDAEPEVLDAGGAAAAPAEDSAQAARVADANARVDRTLGDHVAAAKASGGRIPWPVDIGSRVLLLTPGHPAKKARIRNIQNQGGYALYDLDTETGSTVDGVGAERIARDPEADDQSMRLAALERHVAKGASIVKRLADMEAVERKLADNLKRHREEIENVRLELVAHTTSEPGQTDLRDVVGDGSNPPPKASRKARKDAEPSPREDAFAGDAAPTDAGVRLEDVGLTVEDLAEARFEQGTSSTGKPQQVKPVLLTYADGTKAGPFVLVDVQDGRALLLPILSKQDWQKTAAKTYGAPRKTPGDTVSEKLAKGGRWCGIPVKVGRATCYLGPESATQLVQLPPKQLGDEPEPRAAGKEAAAGG